MSSERKRTPEVRRVALFSASDAGGVARMWMHLAQALLRRGYNVDILVPRLRQGLQCIPEGARAVELADWLPRHRILPAHYMAVPALARYLRRERPSVLLSATTPINIAAVMARYLSRTTVRLVISQHNPVSSTIANHQYRTGAIMPFLVRRIYPMADAVVAVSYGIEADLRSKVGLNCDNIHVIHNPALTDAANRLISAEPEHPWFKNKTRPIVLAVGRLTRQKAFDHLIHSFARLRSHCDARLVIFGNGRERTPLLELVRKYDLESHIDLPGRIENPFAHMARADMFVLSSRFEGFGIVLVEALACGCPVIATDCPGGVREILDGGRFGRLVPVGDVETLSQAMHDTLCHPPDPDPLQRRAADFHVDRIIEQYRPVLGV